MKTRLLAIAIGTALSLGTTLASADSRFGHDRHHDERDEYRGGYRNDYRVEEPRRWGREPEYRHFHERHHWRHHIHDRWCNHWAPPAVRGPRFIGPRLSGFHDDFARDGLTLIFRGGFN